MPPDWFFVVLTVNMSLHVQAYSNYAPVISHIQMIVLNSLMVILSIADLAIWSETYSYGAT